MTKPPIRFGLAGFGAWGQFHAKSIAANSNAQLAAIVAPSAASQAAARNAHPETRVFSDHRQMLASMQLDIVDVTSPSHTHFEIAKDALEAGCHILVEKPLAITIDDAKTIVQLAERKGLQVAVGFEARLSSQWGEIKRLIDAGAVGEPRYVHVELLRKPYRQGASGWRYDPARVGSWVLEEPIHFFDLARWYFEGIGDPVELYAYGNPRHPGSSELYDNFSAMFRYENGAYAVVTQTLAAFEHHLTVTLTGSKGALWAGWSAAMDRSTDPTVFLKAFDGGGVRDVPLERQSGEVFELREEIDRCVKMARGEGSPIANGRDGVWSTGLCLLAQESIRHKRPVAIKDFL